MKHSKTLQMLRRHFDEVQPIEDDIIRCEKLYNNQPFQVLYLDFTNKWLGIDNESKELEHYLENIIQNDYYKNAGYLQWNYYYTFISDDKSIIGNRDKKDKIEGDELYARKHIMTLPQFNEWLIKTETIGKRLSAEIKEDLGVEWINKLKQAKLDAIFLNESFKNGVDRYIQGNPILERVKNSNGQVRVKVDAIAKITGLKLLNYRLYPSTKEFNFGKVNLIKGPNGSGKTSLFEAIELLLCGKTKRNSGRDESNNKIHAVINNDSEELNFTPANNRLFKERDKFWYNTITPANQQSSVYERFNRFNFFNSDAAFQLSYGSQEEIRKAFEDIAIGDEINWLEIRLKKFNDYFNKELSYYSRIIEDSKMELGQNIKLLDEIGRIDNQPENFFKELITEVKRINWIIGLNKEDIETKLEKDISSAKYFIDTIFSESDWIDHINQEKVKKELNKLKNTKENLIISERELNDIKSILKVKKEKYIEIEKTNQLILSAGKYFKDEKISQLESLEEKIDNVSKEHSKLLKIKEAFRKVDVEVYLGSKENLVEYETKLRKETEDLEIGLKEVEKAIDDTEINLNQLDKIVTEIKAKGKEYLQLKEDATICPLCYTQHEKGRLIQLIEEVKKDFQDSEELKHLLDKRARFTNRLIILKTDEANLIKLKEVLYLHYGDTVIRDKIIVETLKDIRYAIKSINKSNEQLTALKNTQLYFDEKGLTAIEFVKLRDQLSDKGARIGENYDNLITEYQDKLKTIQRYIKTEQLAIEDSNEILNNLLEKVDIPIKNAKLLDERIRKLESATENYNELNKIISLGSTTALTSIERDINKISMLFERYKELRKKRKENELRIKASNQKIEELQKKIKSNTPYRVNAKKAYDAIKDILENHSKTEFLKGFIEVNKNEIVDIFKAIHSPREFDDLLFQEGNLSLKRINSDINAELTEISTGQRAALALSVFLALNLKLKNGPNILLFDEPVTNIDDLNVLSFVDFLRELVINSDRQLFFATANENLSYLFKKKFGFLKDNDLKEFILER